MDIAMKGPVETLIFVTDRLIEIMNREIEYLRSMQPQAIRELQQDKANLARSYERCMQELRDDPQLLGTAPAPVKRELRALTGRFQATLAENERALRAVKLVSERLLNVIVNAVSESQAGAAYSATGAIGAAANGRAVSISLNQQL